MNDDYEDMLALLKLLMYAKSEATRMQIFEVERLLSISSLSLFLECSRIDLEEMINISDASISSFLIDALQKKDRVELN